MENKQQNSFRKESKMPPGRIFFGFHLYSGKEEDQLLFDGMETLRGKDRKTRSGFIRFALAEYIGRHLPSGNPQLDIRVYGQTDPVPFSVAAKEKLAPKPPEPDYRNMTVEELEAQLKRRFLSDFDRMAINHFLKQKQQETQK